MSEQERDTHFAGFAELLWEEFYQLDAQSSIQEMLSDPAYPEKWHAIVVQCIARRAYDLVQHAIDTCSLSAFEIMGNWYDDVPDMTAWPESNQER